MANNLYINEIMDDKEYTSVINKKEKKEILKDKYLGLWYNAIDDLFSEKGNNAENDSEEK